VLLNVSLRSDGRELYRDINQAAFVADWKAKDRRDDHHGASRMAAPGAQAAFRVIDGTRRCRW